MVKSGAKEPKDSHMFAPVALFGLKPTTVLCEPTHAAVPGDHCPATIASLPLTL